MYRYNTLHSPTDTVSTFTIPGAGVRRWDEAGIVYDVQVGNGLVLRHYGFRDHWFEINCSLNLAGQFITEPGPIVWTFNCDICTPTRVVGRNAYTMDLFLDVLVAPDGRAHIVIDEEDFAEAIQRRWLTPEEQLGARRGLDELLSIISGPGLLPFLNEVCPFGDVSDAEPQPPLTTLPLSRVPLLAPGRRTEGL
ncbi:MAG: DUF402 domain-containing protein [Bacillota bacterium]